MSRRPVSVIPDGYFVLATPLGKAHFFVEIDRGTETLARFKQKIHAYKEYFDSGAYERRYGTKSMRVLTVATGEGRLTNLWRATGEVTAAIGGQRRFWFGLADRLTVDTVLNAPVWVIAGEQTARPLIDR